MFKRLLAVVVMAGLLMGAKAPAPPSSITITTPVPTVGQVLEFTYVASGLKGYEYPRFAVICYQDGTPSWSAWWYPTLDPSEDHTLAYPGPVSLDCSITMYAFGGNMNHDGFGRLLAGPVSFVAAASG